MSKLVLKILIPVVLASLFSIAVSIALNYQQLGYDFYIVLILLVFFVFSFGFAVGKEFSNPFEELIKKARALSRGDFSARVYLETKDELKELADIFNKIAQELEESHFDPTLIEKMVQEKIKEKTQSLEETIRFLEEKIKNRSFDLEKTTKELENLRLQLAEKEREIIDLKKELANAFLTKNNKNNSKNKLKKEV